MESQGYIAPALNEIMLLDVDEKMVSENVCHSLSLELGFTVTYLSESEDSPKFPATGK